ncbi:pro-sigmaK processing inhibitor BofA family protein [Candidatus Micrarchaeota archaeon]|nr:pro-sigmaK processing inhibitor BofA family protein [Candidatus Micrarchaeota archaeon]
MSLGLIIAFIFSIIAALLLYKILKTLWPLLYNGLLGIGVFWLLNEIGVIIVPINIWTVLIAAIGGIFGVIIVIVLTGLGFPM